MAFQVIMPTFGTTGGEATVTRWFKAIGDRVQADEPLFEAENDKANLEVPAPTTGVLLQIVASEGKIVPVEAVVGWIGEPDERIPSGEQAPSALSGTTAAPAPPDTKSAARMADAAAIKASPIARRLAREHNLDLGVIQGSGPGGRIVEKDLHALLRAKAEAAPLAAVDTSPGGELLPPTALRRITAERLVDAASTTVAVPLFIDVDMTEVQRLRAATRDEYTQRFGAACSYNALILRACAVALRQHPLLNSQWTAQGLRLLPEIHIGLAVATDDGLLVPVVQHADQKPISAIELALKELVVLARQRRLSPQQMSGGTFTITNLGSFGIETFVPVINPPQAAILGIGLITDQVVAIDGQPTVRPRMKLCLVFDHRAVDGAPAAACLARIKALLENPYLLV